MSKRPELTRLGIELTKLCNLRCTMCLHHGLLDQHQADSHPNYMSLPFFKSIIDQFVNLNSQPKYVCPQYQGESLLYPDFLLACDYLEQHGVFINLTTNATLLTKEISDHLLQLDHFYNMAFSVDGYSKKVYESIRIGAHLDTVLDNINYFISERNNLGRSLDIYVNMVLMDQNKHEYLDYVRYWLDKGVRVQISQCTQPDGTILDPDHHWKPERAPCFTLQYSAIILTNGDVVPCCRDHLYQLVMGNLHEDTLDHIWHGTKYNELRHYHQLYGWEFLDLCANCSTWMSEIETEKYRMNVINGDIIVKQGPFWEWFEKVG